ncbi:4Fe-4S dicluster domain-containing protein [Noviherbaspirillum massiliense]|uniref:4Fe-4S dicluster domain-containing protein n=1 Tax=Noviherbaspirillum massiliense TaxID=1465823 RepID=UPI001FDF3A7C|nr:4Fe-4S dicluster domain-containing protein [Noviherbaspirillum massiliense]
MPHHPASHGDADGGHAGMAPDSMERRTFLKIMAASMALASGACSGPPGETIVPYVQMPENMVLGQPLFYATAFVRRGYASGVLVESNMGRPTKVEGNPHHPSSLGASDVFAQASILQLWDPDRSQAVYNKTVLATWQAFETALQARRPALDKNRGAGLRILTGTITSPTLAAQLTALLKRYPEARWHAWDPLHDDGALPAARLAFGQPAHTVFDFSRAARVLCLDADVFGDWPGAVRHARDFTHARKSETRNFFNRMIALESTPTITGAYADSRLALPPAEIERFAWRLAGRLGIPGETAGTAPAADLGKWEEDLAKELNAHRGAGLIAAGASLSPQTRALVHLMNAHLGNAGTTALQIAPVEALAVSHAESIAQLVADMRAGRVDSLFILDANPVYNAPADLDFADALSKVPFSVHLGLYRDETGRRTTWHLPQTHLYEQWSDARAHDGTATILQPVIAPLYAGRSAHELLALLGIDTERNGRALVRRTWQQQSSGDFNNFWEASLRSGLVENSAGVPLKLRPAQAIQPPALRNEGLAPLFAADPSAGDGEFANNAWLQELPRPLSKLTWDNAALLSPATARKLGVDTGDVVRLSLKDRPAIALHAPVWVLPGHADDAVTLPLGYGRTAAGRVGNRVGFDAYRLRTLAAMQGRGVLQLEKTRTRHAFATTQNHARMEGRDLVRMATLEEYRRHPRFATELKRQRVPEESLYPQVVPYEDYKWGMAIDLNTCIGCNACTIACQAENNIPVVGKEEVIRGREMHWIRVDRYYLGKAERPRTVFQPVPCMHCEKAPCEEVCPVGATVHDSEGLNVQVYNRCVGTRFCSNNCPYKVRRFNFLQYSNTDVDSLKALQNPEVTVRRRGVMEKCSYCLQRVARARMEAEKLGRRIQDGEVVTACQAVCPTEAITFGDLNDSDSKVNRVKTSPLDYALLAELNTRPRTTYAARVINADTELE